MLNTSDIHCETTKGLLQLLVSDNMEHQRPWGFGQEQRVTLGQRGTTVVLKPEIKNTAKYPQGRCMLVSDTHTTCVGWLLRPKTRTTASVAVVQNVSKGVGFAVKGHMQTHQHTEFFLQEKLRSEVCRARHTRHHAIAQPLFLSVTYLDVFDIGQDAAAAA